MKPHHVLILAAALFLGTGLYAAYSTPAGATWTSGALSLMVPLAAAAVSIYLATSIRRGDAPRRLRSPTLALLAIAAVSGVVGATSAAFMHAAPPDSLPSMRDSDVMFKTSAGTKATVTLSDAPQPQPIDRTNLVFASGFSAGVALLASITLAFLRACDADEASESSSLPAA